MDGRVPCDSLSKDPLGIRFHHIPGRIVLVSAQPLMPEPSATTAAPTYCAVVYGRQSGGLERPPPSICGLQSMVRPSEQDHFNALERRAILHAFMHFKEVVRGPTVTIATDNPTVLGYLWIRGGTTSSGLLDLTCQLLALATE